MLCRTVFIFLFITFASSRNVPDLRDKFKHFVLQESDGELSSSKNKGSIEQSSGNTCASDENKDCKEKEIKKLLPPQMPQLSGFVNDEERTWLRSPYQVNHHANAGTLGVGVGSHGGVLYPYAHPNLFAAMSPAMPVSHLPPVLTTHVRETAPHFIPHLYTLPRNRFTRGDEEDDFLNQLTHDAIMPNVLPTMSVPMTRSSYGSHVLLGTPPGIALYPANVASCGIPLLLSCSPHISRGVLAEDKNQKQTVISKYKAQLPKEKKEEDIEAKSSDPEALGLPENFQQ